MKRKNLISTGLLIAGVVIYGIIRADAFRLVFLSETVTGKISKVNELRVDPHTTTSKISVEYTFTDRKGKVYHGSGDRFFKKDENAEDPKWLYGTSIDVVYVTSDPDLNDISGHEFAVLFPLILIPFVMAMELFATRQSKSDKVNFKE